MYKIQNFFFNFQLLSEDYMKGFFNLAMHLQGMDTTNILKVKIHRFLSINTSFKHVFQAPLFQSNFVSYLVM